MESTLDDQELGALEKQPGFFDPSHLLAHIGKKIFIAVTLLVAVIFYYVTRYSKGSEIILTFLHLAPSLILLMAVFEVLYFVIQAACFQQIYRMVGHTRRISYLFFMYICMNLVNTIAPVIGLSGTLYMMYLERGKIQRSEGMLINFLYYLNDYVVFLLLLCMALLYLLVVGQITRVIIVTSLIFALFVLGLGALGIFLLSHPTAFHRTVHWFSRFLHKLGGRTPALRLEQRINTFVDESQTVWRHSRRAWRYMLRGAFFAIFLHVSCVIILMLAFMAVHAPFTLQILLAGYTVGTILNTVSPTPAGLGISEGGMTAVFAALGVSVEQALLATLLYRAVFVWFPLALGLIVIHFMPRMVDSLEA